MNIGGRRGPLYWTAVAAVIGALVGVTGCRQTPTRAQGEPGGTTTEELRGMAGAARGGGPGAACVFVKPDGAQRFGHVGWGFRITGTDRWVYGAVENPSGELYTPPGGDIGAWHAEGRYARMLGEMSRDAHYPGRSEHPYSRYRCTSSSTGDVPAARAMIRTVAERGFLVGVDPRTGKLTSRDCLDATSDVLKAYGTRRFVPAPKLSVPNVVGGVAGGVVGQAPDAPVTARCPARNTPDGAPTCTTEAYRPSSTSNSPASRIALTAVR